MQNILIFLTDLWADEGDGEAEFDLSCKEAGAAGGEGSKMCAGVNVAAPPGDETGGEVTAEVADDASVVVVAVASAAVWAAVLWWYGLKYG